MSILVIHRVGGLEDSQEREGVLAEVIHRVGGLEDHNCQGSHQHNVIHRVGGLEEKSEHRYAV